MMVLNYSTILKDRKISGSVLRSYRVILLVVCVGSPYLGLRDGADFSI